MVESGVDMGIELVEEGFQPEYAKEGDAGMTCMARVDSEVIIPPGKCELIPLGFKVEIPNQHIGGFLLPRSGQGHKNGMILGNGTGVIDSGYRGEVMASIWNRKEYAPIRIKRGDRICQIVFLPVVRANFYAKTLSASDRGEGGFGSTG
jgi:dUTP pyrophosphatase